MADSEVDGGIIEIWRKMALLKKQPPRSAFKVTQQGNGQRKKIKGGRSDAGGGGEAKEASQITRQTTKVIRWKSIFEIRPDSSRDGASYG
jgi:hypothetical protein